MIKVDKDLCIGCSACISVCPTNSLVLNEDGKCEVNSESCIQCLTCISTCPVEAISDDKEIDRNVGLCDLQFLKDFISK